MKNTVSIGNIRVSVDAYVMAKERAKDECISMSKWISKAIMEKALLDDLVEEEAIENG